ncbi:MAG: ATP-binding cassette domain-containing protein [Caldilineaceae bacterium]
MSVDVRAAKCWPSWGATARARSTLLRSMVGLVRPQHGEVHLRGASIAGRDVADICREVGYLPQDPNALLFAEQTLDELEITLRNRVDARAGTPPVAPLELLRELGLAHKAQAYPRDLSVGERQRVALGAITVTQPAVLLLDEPTQRLTTTPKPRWCACCAGEAGHGHRPGDPRRGTGGATGRPRRAHEPGPGDRNGCAGDGHGRVAALCAPGCAPLPREWMDDD